MPDLFNRPHSLFLTLCLPALQKLEATNRELSGRCEELQRSVDELRDSETQLQDEIVSYSI